MSALRQFSRSPRALGIAAGLCVAAAVLVLAVALAGGGASGGGASGGGASGGAGPRTAPLESIFQVDVQLLEDPTATLSLLRRLGVSRVRLFFPWGAFPGRPSIAPDPLSRVRPRVDASDPAAYPPGGWAPYDAVVRAAARAGVGLDFNLGPPAPVWAEGPGEPPGGPIGDWIPSAPEFGRFVHAVGVRYSGHYPDPLHPGRALPRVGFWAIWNEPNFGIDLAPQATDHGSLEISPRVYRGLLAAAWTALHQTGHGPDTILIGELSPKGQTLGGHPGNFDGMVPLRFLRALYCVDSSYRVLRGAAAAARGCPATATGFADRNPALFHAAAFSDHPYPQALPPNVPTPDEPDFTDLPALPKLEATLDRLQRIYGSGTRFPVYSTEYGYLTTPPEKLFHAVSPQTAAEYLNWAEYLSWRDPRVRSYDQYLLTDPPAGNFPSGIEFADGTPKPGFAAFRFPIFMPLTTTSPGGTLEVWGCARPARYARIDTGRRQAVQIRFQPASSGPFRTVRTVPLADPYGYFDVRQRFDESGLVRLEWSYPDGQRIFSRSVPVAVR